MTTDCVHCKNPAEVCRGCYERLRREADDRADERLDLQYASIVRQQALTASVTERLVLAEEERDRLRAEVDDLRKCYESGRKCNDDMEEAMFASQRECERLRAQVARLREAAKAITATTCAHGRELPNIDDGAAFLTPAFKIRALAKALEETAPTKPPFE